MDRVKKFLKQLSTKERTAIEQLISKICARNWESLDIKRLVGYSDMYRARKGEIRVIFLDTREGVQIVSVSRRSDTTYS
jgi:mRNA-degrading endonuclease RelE of RelBE toxin-antitoxin system